MIARILRVLVLALSLANHEVDHPIEVHAPIVVRTESKKVGFAA